MRSGLFRSGICGLVFLVSVSCSHADSRPPQPTRQDLAGPTPVPGEPTRVVVYGDSRDGHDVHRNLVAKIIARKPLAVFHTGDLVGDGRSKSEWTTFNEITATLRSQFPFYPALGNHEHASSLYFDNFVLPNNERWYEVPVGALRFIVLDTGSSLSSGAEQYKWLSSVLAKPLSPGQANVAVFHHPLFSSGAHGSDEKGVALQLLPLFERHKVNLVFSGHDHNYERSDYKGIVFVTAGGGGAPLYGKKNSNAYSKVFLAQHHYCVVTRQEGLTTVSTRDQNDRELDSFSVR